MTHAPLSPPQQDLAEELTDALRPRMERLLQEVAALFASKADTHPFGPTEFALRDLIHAATADFLQAALREKKRLPGSCHSLPRLRPSRRLPPPSPALRREPVPRPVVRARLLLLPPL